jgi:hypothetical protein
MALWLAAAWPMRAPARRASGNPSPTHGSAAR